MTQNFTINSDLTSEYQQTNSELDSIINHFLILEENTSIQKLIKTILLENKQTTIGRSDDNDVILSSLQASRYHCYLTECCNEETQEIYYIITDGNIEGNPSNNGLLINQKKVLQSSNLKHGDIIEIGSEVTLTYFVDYEGKFQEQKVKILAQKNLMIETISDGEKEDIEPTFIATYKSNYDYGIDELLKFASIVNLSPYPIIEIDTQGNILFANASAKINFATLLEEKINHPLLKHVLPYLSRLETNLFKREVQVNNLFVEEYIHYLKDLQIIRLYVFDITTIYKQKENLKQILEYDLKTKLPNYKSFIKTLQKTIASYKRINLKLAVMIIEIDRINLGRDTLTPKNEYNLIKNCSEKLKKIFRLEDAVAYWREHQFIVLLSEIEDFSQIGSVSQRVMNNLIKPITVDNKELKLSINIGISVYPHDAENETDLIRKADQALSISKNAGQNQASFYSPKIDFENKELLRLSNELNHALSNQEFIIYYQPIISKDNTIIALEALLRWNHQYKGIISPDKFLDIAKHINIINNMTLWILEDIIHKKLTNYSNSFAKIPIAINVSHQLFQDQNAWDNFIQLIKNNIHLAPTLIIEISNNLWLEDNQGKNCLKKLLSLGIKITLDDFGLHNIYFNNIKKFPFHYLKIAQNFIKYIKDNSQDKAIVSAITTFAKGFNIEVIVEGIENDLQWIILQELGCEYAQGYLFCEPLPFNEINQLLSL